MQVCRKSTHELTICVCVRVYGIEQQNLCKNYQHFPLLPCQQASCIFVPTPSPPYDAYTHNTSECSCSCVCVCTVCVLCVYVCVSLFTIIVKECDLIHPIRPPSNMLNVSCSCFATAANTRQPAVERRNEQNKNKKIKNKLCRANG